MELPHVGAQCALSSCSQHDYLPFKCQHCLKEFCQDHWKVEAHQCAKANSHTIDVRVPVCPLCQQPIPVNRGQDPNIAVDSHIGQGCPTPGGIAGSSAIPTNSLAPLRARNTPSPSSLVCAVRQCSTKLLVKMDCNACGGHYCVRHRLPIDHACESKRTKKGTAASSSSRITAANNQRHQRPSEAAFTAAMRRFINRFSSS
ncbi:hypothetical protein BDF22DRAFT_689666 [Syncephalis plumigaleata]|nr:hypothetical protein BDF22DRAFT_689666 [Syncephalis plumigaleata]